MQYQKLTDFPTSSDFPHPITFFFSSQLKKHLQSASHFASVISYLLSSLSLPSHLSRVHLWTLILNTYISPATYIYYLTCHYTKTLSRSKKLSPMFNTKFHVVIITLNLVLVYAGGRLIPPGSVPSTSMKSLSVDDTINLNPKNQIFRGAEVKSCKPKGFRPRSAPSRFVNYQPLVSVKCSSSKVTSRSKISP